MPSERQSGGRGLRSITTTKIDGDDEYYDWIGDPFPSHITVYDKVPRKSCILGPDGEPLEVFERRQGFIGFIELKEIE